MPHQLTRILPQARLQDALDTLEVDNMGTFAPCYLYDDGPIPTLGLSELGTVELPLSTREVKAVIEQIQPASFNEDGLAMVDKEERHAWAMDASQVQFGRPAWPRFIHRIIRDVCEALNVSCPTSRPRCDLYRLMVHEPGLL